MPKETWIVGSASGDMTIATTRGEHVARMFGPNGFQDQRAMRRRADLIVRAVNAHDDLVAACRAAIADAEGAVNPASRLPSYAAMVAALAKAGKE